MIYFTKVKPEYLFLVESGKEIFLSTNSMRLTMREWVLACKIGVVLPIKRELSIFSKITPEYLFPLPSRKYAFQQLY